LQHRPELPRSPLVHDAATPEVAYASHVGRYGAGLAAGLLDVLGVARGERALDVGCGPGQLTAPLAERLGAEAVSAVDPSEAYVGACRRAVPGAHVGMGQAEDLPFASAVFDLVLAQLVINLLDDPVAGVREMRRVGRPGGTVAASVWNRGAMPVLAAFWDAALELAPEQAAATDRRQQVGYADAGALTNVWQDAGLGEIHGGTLTATAHYRDFEDLWFPYAAGVGRSGALYTSLPSALRAALRGAVRERLGVPDQPFTLTAQAWWVAGTPP
jgi:SAM-dependent methyltransferase